MKEFEYKIFDVEDNGSPIIEITEDLNSYGKNGWELVGLYPITQFGFSMRYIFKKEISNSMPSVLNKQLVDENFPWGISTNNLDTRNTTFDVILKHPGGAKLTIVKMVKECTGLGLKESKELVDSAPKAIKEGCSKQEAEMLIAEFREAGAEVELR